MKILTVALLAVCLVSSVYAAPEITSVRVQEPDIFYSPFDTNNMIHLIVETLGVDGQVQADFSSIAECQGNALVNLTLMSDGIYEGSCNITQDAEPLVEEVKIGEIRVTAVNSSNESVEESIEVVLHNIQHAYPDSECVTVGPASTNLSMVVDFNDVDLALELFMKGGCGQELPWGEVLFPALNITYENLNLSRVEALSSLLEAFVDISYSDTEVMIDINTADLPELESISSVIVRGVPLTADPSISVAVTDLSFLLEEPFVANNMSRPNMTLSFRYDFADALVISDASQPVISIEPINGTTFDGFVGFNVTVNGTGSGVSDVSLEVDGSEISHDDCLPLSVYGDAVLCNVILGNFSVEEHSMNVQATDVAGNDVETVTNFLVGGPVLTFNGTSSSSGSIGTTIGIFTNWTSASEFSCNLYASSSLLQSINSTQTCDFNYTLQSGNAPAVDFVVVATSSFGHFSSSSNLTVTLSEACGDNVCQSSESCSSCSQDCGRCSSGGGGGGGSRGGGGSPSTQIEWECGDWSMCVNSRQTQNCTYKTSIKYNIRNCTMPPKPKPINVTKNASQPLLAEQPVNEQQPTENFTEGENQAEQRVQTEEKDSNAWIYGLLGTIIILAASYFLFKMYKKRMEGLKAHKADEDMPLIKP